MHLKNIRTDMPLTSKQNRFLRGLAHSLQPVVIIGQHGITTNVENEIEQALLHHELIKLRVNAEDRGQRTQMIEAILTASHAELVARIGHIAVLYRANPKKPKIELPNAKKRRLASGDKNGENHVKRKSGQNKR